MIKISLTALLLVAGLSSLSAQTLHIDGVKVMLTEAKKEVKEISATELKKLIDEDTKHFVLIDLRGEAEKAHGEIYHFESHQIERGYLEFKIEGLVKDKNTMIIIYGCTGNRSLLAAQTLLKMGYKNVYSLHKGLRGWVDQGLPLDTVYGEMILKPMETK